MDLPPPPHPIQLLQHDDVRPPRQNAEVSSFEGRRQQAIMDNNRKVVIRNELLAILNNNANQLTQSQLTWLQTLANADADRVRDRYTKDEMLTQLNAMQSRIADAAAADAADAPIGGKKRKRKSRRTKKTRRSMKKKTHRSMKKKTRRSKK